MGGGGGGVMGILQVHELIFFLLSLLAFYDDVVVGRQPAPHKKVATRPRDQSQVRRPGPPTQN